MHLIKNKDETDFQIELIIRPLIAVKYPCEDMTLV